MISVLHWLAAQGGRFVLLRPRSKRPLVRGWPDTPASLLEALRHARAGGNVGLLVGTPSENLVCLDVDQHFSLTCALLPELTRIRIVRPDAPDRGKVLFRLDDLQEVRNRSWGSPDTAPSTVELLAHRRLAVIPPSVHPSGASYVLQRQTEWIPGCSPPLLENMWQILTAETLREYPHSLLTQLPHLYFEMINSLALTKRTRHALDISTLRASISRQFPSVLAVFRYFGRVMKVQRVGRYDLRLLGNGGLVVGDPDSPFAWRWYCFRDSIGGDIFDAVGYCVVGRVWDRHRKQHWRALQNSRNWAR